MIVQAWLAKYPDIKIVSRNRSRGNGEAATNALPEAIQIADGWHPMENASASFLDAVQRSKCGIQNARIDFTAVSREIANAVQAAMSSLHPLACRQDYPRGGCSMAATPTQHP